MSRWSQLDSHEERLPDGLRRVGYDADTQRYTYQDSEGAYYEGPEGAAYGQLERLSEAPDTQPLTAADIESQNAAIKRSTRDAYRQLLPFALLAIVFLLLLFRFIGFGDSPKQIECVGSSKAYKIHRGDTCWAIAEKYKVDVESLRKLNDGIDCGSLVVGKWVCVPEGK